jgi:cell division protein FtsW
MFVMLFTSLYILYPHFNYRINQYFSILFKDNVKNTFQVENSLNAFANGGLTGKGLWGGGIKNNIPDGHTDFIFSVIGEELGCLFCIFLLGIYFYITLKFITKTINSKDNFKNISIISLSVQFLLQALINICSTLALIPTKGMTLPLISYGGSSMMGTAFTLGFLLALSRKEYGEIINENVIIEI